MNQEPRKLAISTDLHCLECRHEWTEPTERWRMYMTVEDEPEVGLYCPICASYEFDE
jgi:hypothetical protein